MTSLLRFFGPVATIFCAAAAQAQTVSYSCNAGQLVVKSSNAVTLEEWTVLVGLDVRERPDFGHYVFERPDGQYEWARTSDMARACSEKAECFPAPAAAIGLAAGPLVRRNDDGSISTCEEEEEEELLQDVPFYACHPDGSLGSATVPNDPDHLRNFFGLAPYPGPGFVLFRDGTGASVWSNLSPAALATECPEPQTEGPPNDGVWEARLRTSSNEGCPPQAIAQAEASAAMLSPTPKRIVWTDPFNPAQLLPDDDFVRPWTPKDPRWDALVVSQDHGVLNVSVLFNLAVMTPDQIVVDAVVDMNITAQAAIAAGLPAKCSYLATFDIIRTED